MTTPFSSTHLAVEHEDLPTLKLLLDAGADVHEESNGLTLLHHAVDVEIDGHTQTGAPLHVDVTAYLLARGADPRRKSHGGLGESAQFQAVNSGHWLAAALFEAWPSKSDR